MLDVKGLIITADAMHCQKETAETIVNNGGDYVLQLKANQKSFYEDVYAMFDDKYINESDQDCEYEIYKIQEKSHGRIETRTCYVLNEIAFFTDYLANWKGLKRIFAVAREIEKNGKITKEISCYLSSKNTTAENLLSYICLTAYLTIIHYWKLLEILQFCNILWNDHAHFSEYVDFLLKFKYNNNRKWITAVNAVTTTYSYNNTFAILA